MNPVSPPNTLFDSQPQTEAELRAENARLRQQVQRLQSVIDNMPTGFSLLEPIRDATGQITDFRNVVINVYSAQRFGRTVSELTGRQGIGDLFPGWQQTENFAIYQQVFTEGHPRSWVTLYDQFGMRNWFDVAVRRVDEYVLVSFTDITALRETQLQEQQQAKLLQTIVDTSPTGIVLYEAVRDPEANSITDFRYQLVNPENARVTGRSMADFQAKTLLELFPQTGQEPFFQTLLAVTQTGKAQRMEFPYERDGISGWFDGSFIRQGDGVLFTFLDITAIKQAQVSGQQSSELLRKVMDASPAGISLMQAQRDPDGKLVDFRLALTNQATANMTGRTVADIQGKSVIETFPTYRSLGIYDRYRTVLETGQPARFEVHYQGDGLENWFDIAAHRQGDGVVGTFLDITPIRQAQQAAQQQQELVQSVLNASLTAVAVYEAVRTESTDGPPGRTGPGTITDFRFTLANQTTLAVFGLRADELYGKTLTELNPPLRTSPAFAQYVAVCETGQPVILEREVRGRYYYVSVVRFGDGILTSSVDITENRQYRNQLETANALVQDQRDLLQSVLNGSQNAIIAFDAVRSQGKQDQTGPITDFRYVLQNEANRQRVGRSDEVLLGRTMLEFFPDVATNGLLEQYAQVVETGEPLRFELEYTYGNVPGWYDYSVVKRGDGLVMTVHDKTTERRARLLVEHANAELLKSNENLQNFAYVASHDLQEPLRKIKSFGDLVLEQYGSLLPETGQDMLHRMQTAAERMSGLIRDLLALSRLTTHQKAFTRVDLNRLLAEVLGDLETAVADTGAVVESAAMPTVPGDALQLRQLFQNLLTNALKFTRPGQTPKVEVGCERVHLNDIPSGLLSPTFGGGDNRPDGEGKTKSRYAYRITVSDDGIGFNADKHGERIFGAFQRLHGRTGNYPGTGIGLAIAKRVVENHGGGIVVHSREGEGATFSVYLPIAPE
ncbi:PAS domain-containing protein [uncultured Fibrella sp.]|uniref:PAS domain-containing protein n=1 Tax=uncultured Fibrella sp. TaxID=1284596 RepID=UPI0035C971A1